MIWQLPYSKETQYMIDSVCSEILGHLGGGKNKAKQNTSQRNDEDQENGESSTT